jgi:putative transposase
MARHPRFDLVGISQHVIQRGNNRMPCFADDADRTRYLHLLGEALQRFECELHAYALMGNHTHLLITPRASRAIPRLMHTFGRNYATYFNRRHARTGTLWEGRYKSCLVDSERYALACHRYIELNPVRAGLVQSPAEYPWSSFPANALGRSNPLLAPHPVFAALAADPRVRALAYRALFDLPLGDEVVDEIRLYTQQQRVLGTSHFQACVEARVQRCCEARPAHRPSRARTRQCA